VKASSATLQYLLLGIKAHSHAFRLFFISLGLLAQHKVKWALHLIIGIIYAAGNYSLNTVLVFSLLFTQVGLPYNFPAKT